MTVSPEDIAEMRRQGDLKEFLLSLTGRVPQQPTRTEPAPAPELHRERPGAWPTGTRPPDPAPPWPPGAAEAAIEDYRRWLQAGRPPASDHCPCVRCRRTTGGLA